MTKILVLYHSSYGHVERLAEEIAAGAAAVEGVEVTIKRVPDTMSEEAMRAAGMKVEQAAPFATPAELADYDGIIFGSGTRFGNMTGQMRTFLDQTGPLWARGALVGKVGGVFVSTATLGGGQETTAMSFITTLLHHGMIVLGPSYAAAPLNDISEIRGGSPYAAGTIAGPKGDRGLSEKEAEVARFQGRRVAETARKLFG